MPDKSGLTKEDVRAWQDLELTQMFFGYVRSHREYEFSNLRGHLDKNELDEAALTNAGIRMLEEVENIVDEMLDAIEEDAT